MGLCATERTQRAAPFVVEAMMLPGACRMAFKLSKSLLQELAASCHTRGTLCLGTVTNVTDAIVAKLQHIDCKKQDKYETALHMSL